MSKTTTLIFHHGRCNPARWTIADVTALADYLRTGEPQHAVALDHMGIEVASSDHCVEHSAMMREAGFMKPDDFYNDRAASELGELVGYSEQDVVPVLPVFVGQPQFAARYYEGDEDGSSEAWELFPTSEDADKFAASFRGDGREPSQPAEALSEIARSDAAEIGVCGGIGPVTDKEVEHATLRSIGLDPNDYESSQSYTLGERQKEMMRVALQAFADGRV
jgi:hypothetical protein